MYIDITAGKKKVKDGAIIWKTFGVIAAIFLILFFICSGVAKTIMGVLCALNVLFIVVTFCAGFINRGNKAENEEIKKRVTADSNAYQKICMNPDNKDFLTEFSGWYLLWSKGKYDARETGSKLTAMGLSLQTCKHNGKGVFEECVEMFHNGVVISENDKIDLIDNTIKLADSTKDSERDVFKRKIISIVSKYASNNGIEE